MAKKITEEQKSDAKIQELINDIDRYGSLARLLNLEGGEVFVNGLKKDVSELVDKLLFEYREADPLELLATISILDTKLNMLRAIYRSKTNLEFAEEYLDSLLN